MLSLPCSDPPPLRLDLDPSFQPCETVAGDELYPNGIFEFNITRLSAYIVAAGRFGAEPVTLDSITYGGTSPGLNQLTIAAADLSRPVILAEISPGRYNLIDAITEWRRPGARACRAFSPTEFPAPSMSPS